VEVDCHEGVIAVRPGVMQSLCVRLGVAMLAMLWSVAAGAAVTYDMNLNNDPAMCPSFLKMVKAAHFASMTDKQLCEFDFSTLPAAKANGFTFLH
jgi:hypothetical protein